MSWISVEFLVAAHSHAVVCELLDSAGALAITSLDAADQPVLEPAPGQTPLWPQVRLTALFEGDYDPAALLALLSTAGVECPGYTHVADQHWARSGQEVAAPTAQLTAARQAARRLQMVARERSVCG